ncbi:MAG: MBL fold metallo-hydrolase [Opitutales bacterium]
MQIYNFQLGSMGVNSFLIFPKDTQDAILIDAPEEACEVISSFLEEKGRTLSTILLTHGHFDHAWDCAALKEATGAKVYAHKDTCGFVETTEAQSMFGVDLEVFKVDEFLVDNQILEFGDVKIECLYAPGHCAGSMMFYIESEKQLFAGDVIFQMSVGRHDLPTGSFGVLQKSIRNKIYTLPEDVAIFCGHGDSTSVGAEKKYNPFVSP